MKAQYWGIVDKIIPQYGVEIEFSGYIIEGAFGTGYLAWGKLVRNFEDAKENIMLFDYLYSKDITKIARHQPAGIIAGSVDYESIKRLDKLNITAVVLEGYGKLKVHEDCKDLLEQSLGRNTILKATTQVRAGVIRPEIVIASDEDYYKRKKVKGKVRIVWGQYYGTEGVMKGQPHYAEISSGITTWVCDVSCDDGKVITVPISNLQSTE